MPTYTFAGLTAGRTATVYKPGGGASAGSVGSGTVDSDGTLTIDLPDDYGQLRAEDGRSISFASSADDATTQQADLAAAAESGGTSVASLDHLSARYVWSAVDPEYTTLDWADASQTVVVVSGDGVTAEAGAAPQLSEGVWTYATWCQIPGGDAARFFEFYNNASDPLDSSAQWAKAGAAPGTSGVVVVTEPLDLLLDVEHAVGSAQNVMLNVTFVKIA